MEARPVSVHCLRSLNQKKHACFGISPFNSYFSEGVIRHLAQWGVDQFEAIHFFVPDQPSAYTLEALGYDQEKAEWKARRQGQYLKNKIHRALRSLGFSTDTAWEMVVDWSRLSQNARFNELHQNAWELFRTDATFQSACLEASRWVLEKRVADTALLNEQVLHSAVRYFLAELPMFADAAGILEQKASVFCYHQCIPFLEALYERKLPYPVAEGQGFLILEALLESRGVGPSIVNAW